MTSPDRGTAPPAGTPGRSSRLPRSPPIRLSSTATVHARSTQQAPISLPRRGDQLESAFESARKGSQSKCNGLGAGIARPGLSRPQAEDLASRDPCEVARSVRSEGVQAGGVVPFTVT